MIQPAQTETPTAPAAVETTCLGKAIDGRAILRDIDLRIGAGEYVTILGGNGAGKSTLLRIIATLIPPTGGKLELFGEIAAANTVHLRRRIGLIAHQSMLYRDLSAAENLQFFARLYGVKDANRRTKQMLDMVGLSTRTTDPIRNFSRGMLQRVTIARALVHNPDLLLADEPFTGLDAPSIASLESLLSQLNEAGKTIVMVNHDIDQSLRLAERAVVLRAGRLAIDQSTHRLYAREVLSEVLS